MDAPLSPEALVRDFMATFAQAWPTRDGAVLRRFFSEDAEYRNGPSEPVRGRKAIIDTLAAMMSIGGEVDADIIHLVADGPIVMTERVDSVKRGKKAANIQIAGVLEVHDGAITAWRDYFDSTEFGSQLSSF